MTEPRFRLLVTSILLAIYIICASYTKQENPLLFFYGMAIFVIFVIEWGRGFMKTSQGSDLDPGANAESDSSVASNGN